MRHIGLFLIFVLFVFKVQGQDTISKDYLKHRFYDKVDERKAKYIKFKVQELDGAITKIGYLKKPYRLLFKESIKDGEQVGKWLNYSENGELTQELDFDFKLSYEPQKLDSFSSSFYKSKGVNIEEATFPEGNFRIYVQRNVIYPTIAAEGGIKGKVVIVYLVDENGQISDIQVKQRLNPLLEKECVRIIKQSPTWKPAFSNGHAIKISYEIPVVFQLQ
jgi:TonB family protein